GPADFVFSLHLDVGFIRKHTGHDSTKFSSKGFLVAFHGDLNTFFRHSFLQQVHTREAGIPGGLTIKSLFKQIVRSGAIRISIALTSNIDEGAWYFAEHNYVGICV